MKIQSLKLERFGHFQGATLDFADGLQLLHGKNEAGKSTLLAALRALLFQFPRAQYDFRFAETTLAISSRIAFANGDAFEVRREKNKGWKAQPKLADDEFRARLGHPSEELFKNVFAFGLAELAAGAASIQEAGLGSALSGAAVGGGIGPDALAAELKKQADELWTERGKKPIINALVLDIRERQKLLRESELRGESYRALEDSLAQEKTRASELRLQRESLLKRASLIESALRALPAKEALAGARSALERLGNVPPLPASAEAEFSRIRGERDRLAARLGELDEKLARAKNEFDSLGPDEAAPPADPRLAQLIDSWSGHAQRKEQLEEASAERERLSQERKRLRARLDPPWTNGDPPLPVPRVEEIRRHKSAIDQLSRARDSAARDRDRAARELQQARDQAERQAGEAPSPDELTRLRKVRDELFEKIRKSWLEGALTGGEGSGDLFRHSSERQLAGSFAAASQAADQYADEMRRRATDVAAAAEAAQRRDERARALADAERELVHSQEQFVAGEANWSRLWERCGFLPHSPDAMLEWLADYHSLLETAAQLEAVNDRVLRLAAATGEYEASLGGSDIHQLRQQQKAAFEREQQRIRVGERRRHLQKSLEDLTHEGKQTRSHLQSRESELAALRARASAPDDDAFLTAAASAREAADLGKEIARAERTLAEARALADVEEVLGRGKSLLETERDELNQARTRLESELQETDRRVGAGENELRQLSGKSSLEQQASLESRRAELRDRVVEWARLTAARAMLEKQLAKFSLQQQPRMLDSVSRLFSAMTRGRYARVIQRIDREFVAVRNDGVEVVPSGLSTGTREQLYLAVRLAYIDSYCARSEPLPLILDDVLVNFDDERAAATLDVLAHFAAEGRVQVLFLTCHAHLIELSKKSLPALRPAELPPAS
jgi:uncharacterized protein YhaN